ncbi:GNAT family protein [Streptomyces sp. NPDC004232]|uniref:GNAT family N-acetyltransferase n=1 Tax=unclassified Streptomyces TaxID=2593676 RepID=UPI00339E6724
MGAPIDGTVRLRPVREEDLPVLESFLTDPEAAGPFQWYGWSDPGRWRRRWAEDGLLTDEGGQLVVDTGGGALGFVAWRRTSAGRTPYWNVGAQLRPEARGRGIGTAAQRLLVGYLFAHSPVVRLEADTETGNIAEQRSLEKAGFTREGVMRAVGFRDGQWRDAVRYAVIRGDTARPDTAEGPESGRA